MQKQNAATICDTISKECEIKLAEKEHEHICGINRLQLILSEKEMFNCSLNQRLSTTDEQLVELQKKLKDQNDEKTGLRVQISQQQSDMKALRQEMDDRICQIGRDAQNELQSSQDKIKALKRENQTLLSRLGKGRVDEQREKEVETSLHAEKARLQEELRNLYFVVDDKNKEVARIRNEAADENRKLIEGHGNDVQEYRRRLAETNAMLREVEARGILLEDQYQARIEADRKAAESKLLALEKEFGNALQGAKDQSAPSQWHSTQDTTPGLSNSKSVQNIPTTKPRKKVNRDNQSVIEATQEQTGSLQFPPSVRAEISQAQSIDPDLFSVLFDDGNSAQTDGINNSSIFNHGFNTVPGTQDLGDLTLSQMFFSERADQDPQEDTSYRDLSSTELTSIASEELTQMQKEAESISRPKVHGQGSKSDKPGKSLDTGEASSIDMGRTRMESSHSYSTQERPRSQANTSSRMMPRDSSSPQIETLPRSRVFRIKLPSHQERFDDIPENLSGTGLPYTRKRDRNQTERDSTSKRQRVLPAARSGVSSSGSQKISSRSSRQSDTGLGSLKRDASDTKCTPSKSPHPRSQDHSFETQSRTHTQVSPEKAYISRRQGSSQPSTALPTRRSSRVARSKSEYSGFLDFQYVRATNL